jgi:hypothetical protein
MLFWPNFRVESLVQAGSAGRTTRPRSSIQIPIGTLMNWYAVLMECCTSISVV